MAKRKSGATVATESDENPLGSLLEYAVLAPSGHNTQPWLFRLTGEDSLHLIADRTRALPAVDPHDRELTISCGAALDHLEVATQVTGRALEIDICPDSAEPDILAKARIGGECVADVRDLFDAIPQRRTTRAKFDARLLPRDLAAECVTIAESYGIELTLIVDTHVRSAIAELVAEGDRIQFADPGFRRELAAWVRSRRHASQDGMSGSAFGMPDVLSPLGALIIRAFDLGNGIANGDREKIIEGSPTLAVFSSPADTTENWLQTGRALSRVLLTLTANGVTASYLNPPVELDQLRARLRDVVNCTGIPQLLMRFGYGPAAGPTVRRSVDRVLVGH